MNLVIQIVCYYLITEFILYWYHRLLGHIKTIDFIFWGHLEHHKIYNKISNYSEKFKESDKIIHHNFILTLPIIVLIVLYGYFFDLWFALFFLSYSYLTGYIHTRQHTIKNSFMSKYHENHHKSVKCNYGILTPMYDILFGTYKSDY